MTYALYLVKINHYVPIIWIPVNYYLNPFEVLGNHNYF